MFLDLFYIHLILLLYIYANTTKIREFYIFFKISLTGSPFLKVLAHTLPYSLLFPYCSHRFYMFRKTIRYLYILLFTCLYAYFILFSILLRYFPIFQPLFYGFLSASPICKHLYLDYFLVPPPICTQCKLYIPLPQLFTVSFVFFYL